MKPKITGKMEVDYNFAKDISVKSLNALVHIIKNAVRTADFDTVDINPERLL